MFLVLWDTGSRISETLLNPGKEFTYNGSKYTFPKIKLIYNAGNNAFSHQQGLVDLDFIDRSGDKTYAVGQRLLIRDSVVREFADLIEELSHELTNKIKIRP